MEIINFDYTLATFIRLKNDLSKLLNIILVITQILFFGFYAYQIIVNLKNLVLLIIYSSLALLSFIYFVYFLFHIKGYSERVKKIKSKRFRRLYRLSKHLIKTIAISFAIYQLIKFDTSQIMILLTAFSSILLLVNIVAEIIIVYIDKSIDRMIIAFYMDRDGNMINKLITGDLNRKNFIVSDEDDLRKSIQEDKDKYIKNKPVMQTKKTWLLEKAEKFLTKHYINHDESDNVKTKKESEEKK